MRLCGVRDFAQKTNRLPHTRTQAPENAGFFLINWQGAAYLGCYLEPTRTVPSKGCFWCTA